MKKDTSKSTILVISMGFLILYIAFSLHWALIASLSVGMIGIISSTASKMIEKAWFKFSKILSYIVPTVLLGIIFYLVLFPIALVSKLFTKDPLMLSNKYKTYFVSINREVDKKYFEKIW